MSGARVITGELIKKMIRNAQPTSTRTRRTHSKTFHKDSRLQFVSGARGRGAGVPSQNGRSVHASLSRGCRLTTRHQAVTQ